MYDICIIGAGVVGSCIASQLSKYDINILVVEKENDVSSGASMANSGIVHGGYDAVENSLKAKLNVEGSKLFKDFAKLYDIPYKKNGSLVIAFDKEEEKTLHELYKRGKENNVESLEILDENEILEKEVNISKKVYKALYCKDAAITSPWDVAIACMENAIENGVEIWYENEVISIKEEKYYNIKCKDREDKINNVSCKWIINCAGVYADKINDMVNKSYFEIIPRKGEYYLFDKVDGDMFKSTIFQCPSKKGKGVLSAPTVHGNMLIGPNANEIEDKDDNSTTFEGLKYVKESALRISENIHFKNVIRTFAGIRATEKKGDFIIERVQNKNFINVAGIDSPGLSSVPAIMIYVDDIYKKAIKDIEIKENYTKGRKQVIRFSELNEKERIELVKKDPSYGRIVCRCETVCEGEIIDSIYRKCGARDIKGVKKRTRAGAGRCQSGFCLPRVVEILKRELDKEIDKITYDGKESNFLSKKD